MAIDQEREVAILDPTDALMEGSPWVWVHVPDQLGRVVPTVSALIRGCSASPYF
jgi:hypothetical protein